MENVAQGTVRLEWRQSIFRSGEERREKKEWAHKLCFEGLAYADLWQIVFSAWVWIDTDLHEWLKSNTSWEIKSPKPPQQSNNLKKQLDRQKNDQKCFTIEKKY